MAKSKKIIPPALTITQPSGLCRRWATPRAVMALMLREMSTRYGRSPGGYVWAILEPLGTVLILAFGFSLLLHAPSMGTSFVLFYMTGFLPFALYQNVALYVARAINFSRPLLMYPAVTWIDAVLARFVLNALTGLLVTYLLLAGILLASETRTVLNLPPLLAALSLALMLGLGLGVLNCALIGLVPAWDLIWSILTRPLFLASGVLFIFEDMPRTVQTLLWYNPLMHVAGYMRMGFYPIYSPQYLSPIYVIVVALICLVMGLILLGRYHRDILNAG